MTRLARSHPWLTVLILLLNLAVIGLLLGPLTGWAEDSGDGEPECYVWTGAYDGVSFFHEANWAEREAGGQPAGDAFSAGVPVNLRLLVDSGMVGGSAGVGGNVNLGPDGELLVRGGEFRMNPGYGIHDGSVVLEDGILFVRFFASGCHVDVRGGELQFEGGGNPLSEATLDIGAGSTGVLHFLNESPAAVRAEHLAKFTVGGQPAAEDSNVFLVSDGESGTWVTIYQDADGDQMPDGWESEHFGNIAQGGSGDPDLDDIANLEEYRAGSDPNSFDLYSLGETGVLKIAQNGRDQWHRIDLKGVYDDPVVVMGPPSRWIGYSPVTGRVRNVDHGSFEFQLSEWVYLDGVHPQIDIAWLIIDAGRHVLADGRVIEARHAAVPQDGQTVQFDQPFAQIPLVLAQIASFRGTYAATPRVTDVDVSSFEVLLQNHESVVSHGPERVDWIAIEPGTWETISGPVVGDRADTLVDDAWTAVGFGGAFNDWEPPRIVIAGGVGMNGPDPVMLRYKDLVLDQMVLTLEEDKSVDSETDHLKENVSWLVTREGPFGIRATTGDGDADGLPDDWETAFGIDAVSSTSHDGYYGDPDGDRLSNRDEYLAGTDPREWDTDGDSVNDFDELEIYGSDPLAVDNVPPVLVRTLAPSAPVSVSSGWTETFEGYLFCAERRGTASYAFELAQAGLYVVEVRAEAAGIPFEIADLPLVVSVDGVECGRPVLRSVDGGEGVVRVLTPSLAAGSHVLDILYDNVRADRLIRVTGVAIYQPAGADLDSNGTPDWVEEKLAQENAVLVLPETSLTSPVCVEGRARYFEGLAVTADGQSVPALEGIGTGWFADAPLLSDQPTSVDVSFEGGAVGEAHTVVWLETDILVSDDLIVRKGDSLLLTGREDWGLPFDLSSLDVTVTINGGEAIYEFKGDAAVPHQFTVAGEHAVDVVVRHDANRIAEGSITVTVLDADFGPELPVYVGRPRYWQPGNIDAADLLTHDPEIDFFEQYPPTEGGRLFLVDTNRPGPVYVLARWAEDGPVLGRGTIRGYSVASTVETRDNQIIQTYANGDRVVQTSIVAPELPPGGYIKVELFTGQAIFLDGTSELILTATDFDENGIALIRFLYSGGAATSVCHRIYLYDADGELVGEW